MDALQKAKEALIGFAISYPEMFNSDRGPGHMPCPDRTNDGDISSSETSCSVSAGSGTFIGRLPWRYMGVDEIRDAANEILWYAISDDFNFNTSIINSETQAILNLDGNDDVVAVLIAPGEPVCDQDRISGQLSESNYLEGENGEADSNADEFFVTHETITGCNDEITFNDLILPITRSELMIAIERRTNGDVVNLLNDYRLNYGTYPWLVPFRDADTGKFVAEPGVREGLLPILIETSLNTDFLTDLFVQFSDNFSILQSAFDGGTLGINQSFLDSIENFFFDTVSGDPIAAEVEATCQWRDANYVEASCNAEVTDPTGNMSLQIDLDGMTKIGDSATQIRIVEDVILVGESNFQISKSAEDTVVSNHIGLSVSLPLGLNSVDDQLPTWFFNNEWHRLTAISIGSGFTPTSVGIIDCSTPTNCVTVENLSSGGTANGIFPAVVISAGLPYTGQVRSAYSTAAYFESNNATTSDDNYRVNPFPTNAGYLQQFNDQIRVIEP